MYLENIVIDAADPRTLADFWEQALGTERVTDEDDIVETRLTTPDGPWLDLCFPRVQETSSSTHRLHLDLLGGSQQQELADRLVRDGARPADVGQGDVPWIVLADPEANPFCVLEERPEYTATGPVAALVLQVADPEREQAFWAEVTGWVPADIGTVPTLRHPSGRGPTLEMLPEPSPKDGSKNRVHLDVRLEPGEDFDTVAEEITRRGGTELQPDWGDLPWRVFTDPSGNEFCVLPAAS